MVGKIVEFSTPGTRLSIANGQLLVRRPGKDNRTVPIEDIGVAIVDDIQATYTQAALLKLLEVGATILVSGANHLPRGLFLPLGTHYRQATLGYAQASVKKPKRKRLWKNIVVTKVLQQGRVLRLVTGADSGLERLSKTVRSGDQGNVESHAAQRYWPRLFGKNFRRNRDLAGINAMLNYGYAVFRAGIARAVVAAGLIPSLGIFHHHRANPFCLVDDLLEPYRPIVDWRVKTMCDASDGAGENTAFDRQVRTSLLALMHEPIPTDAGMNSVMVAMLHTATSFGRAVVGDSEDIVLPQGIPLVQPENGIE